MIKPINAFEHEPSDFIRDVSLEAIDFYTNGLEGLHVPDERRVEFSDSIDLNYWKPMERLAGKFGRFVVGIYDENRVMTELEEDILVMGTTVALGEPDRHGDMTVLQHIMFDAFVHGRLLGRFENGRGYTAVDYGSTHITIIGDEIVDVDVGASSYAFGRADERGRLRTVEQFKEKLDGVNVVNVDPTPREREIIIS